MKITLGTLHTASISPQEVTIVSTGKNGTLRHLLQMLTLNVQYLAHDNTSAVAFLEVGLIAQDCYLYGIVNILEIS